MVKDNEPNTNIDNDEIMNRVNQTFDQISQEVKEMVQSNDQASENEYT